MTGRMGRPMDMKHQQSASQTRFPSNGFRGTISLSKGVFLITVLKLLDATMPAGYCVKRRNVRVVRQYGMGMARLSGGYHMSGGG